MELRSKVPSGPIDQKWTKHKFDMKLVSIKDLIAYRIAKESLIEIQEQKNKYMEIAPYFVDMIKKYVIL